MVKNISSIPNPPTPPVGQYASWDGSKWVFKNSKEASYISPYPENIPEGYYAEWNEKEWVIKALATPTELEKAEWYLQGTAWIVLDGIIDFLPNAAAIKAARLAAIEIIKTHKAEVKVASNFE